MFDLNDLRYFLAVAQAGSFSGAARRLGVTHATVGRRIAALEGALDARLVERTAYGYVLTPAGREVLASAEAIDQQAWSITKAVAGDEERIVGVVRLATSDGLGNCWLVDKLGALSQRHPEIELEVAINTELLDLLRREADIALRIGRPGSDELVGRSLGKIACGLYAADSYLEEFGEPKQLAQLAHHRMIESIGGVAQLPQARELREHMTGENIALSVDSMMSLLSAARHGLGIVALPSYMTSNAPELKRILRGDFEVRLDLWLLTHQDLRYTARIRAVRDHIVESVKRDTLLLSGFGH